MSILSPLIMNNALCLFNLAMEHDLFYLQYAQKTIYDDLPITNG